MDANLDLDAIRDLVRELPELAAWPEVVELFAPREDRLRMDWQLPVIACRAAGGDPEVALYAAAAIACLQISIILVDDMLDLDPRGEYHRLGHGRTANLALALQSGSFAILGRARGVAPERKAQACLALAQAALTTAYGQDLDVQNLRGEENYWRVVRTKSTPFYSVALQTGGLLGGASERCAQDLCELGTLLGENIQILDDLVDAFATPPNPDWREGRNNLALLYAAEADHPQREQFRRLFGHVQEPGQLDAAQQILITSGAVSYCVYLLIDRYQRGLALLREVDLPHPGLVAEPFAMQVAPLAAWLQRLGLPLPSELDRSLP